MREALRVVARAFALVALLAVMAALLQYVLERPPVAANTVTRLALAVGVLSALVIGLSRDAPLLGFVGVYGLYLILSHLGAVGATLGSPDALAGYTYRNWFFSPSRPMAVALAGLGIGAFALAAALVGHVVRRRPKAPPLSAGGEPGVYYLGLALLSGATLYLLAAVATGALPVLGSYAGYRRAMDELPAYDWMLFLLATGLAFVLAAGDRRRRIRAGLLFLIPAGVLLLSGNRGEVLYPLAAAISVFAVRGARLRAPAVALLATVFFVVIPLVRQVRGAGVAEADLEAVRFNPLAPFVELGFTLRPVVVTVEWIDQGEELAAGNSYWLPVQRLVGLVVPLVERPEFHGSRYFIKERTLARGRGMGYSVIAEAYFNFGVVGVLTVLGGIGALLAGYADRARTSRGLAFAGAVMATLVNNIRNAFGFVPGQLAAIAVLYLAAMLLDRALRPRWPVAAQAGAPIATHTYDMPNATLRRA